MSYCRWSSDNWRCDLYCYEAVEGYVIHIAGNRLTNTPPTVPFILHVTLQEFGRAYRHQMRWLHRKAKREPIGRRYAGRSFYGLALAEFLAKLLELRRIGYRFPFSVIEDVSAELAEAVRKHD